MPEIQVKRLGLPNCHPFEGNRVNFPKNPVTNFVDGSGCPLVCINLIIIIIRVYSKSIQRTHFTLCNKITKIKLLNYVDLGVIILK